MFQDSFDHQESRLPQTLEDTYRAARARLRARIEEFRHMPEMREYIITRIALVQQLLTDHYAYIPCWIEPYYTEYTNADERDLSLDADMGFALCFAEYVGRRTRQLVALAVNDYLAAIDRQPEPQPQQESEPLHLLPQWCISRAETTRR